MQKIRIELRNLVLTFPQNQSEYFYTILTRWGVF